MGFIQKLVQQFKGASNDALDAVADNSRAVRQSVRDMQIGIEKATQAVAEVNAQKTLLESHLAEAKEYVSDLGERAKRAVALKDDALATEALNRQVVQEGLVKKYQDQLDQLNPQVTKLNQILADRKEQLENAKVDSDVIQATDRVADATSAAAKSLSSVGAAGTFQAAKDNVAKKAATADALLELNENPDDVIEHKLRQMETGASVAERLAALKTATTS